MGAAKRGYPDLHEHLAALEAKGLLRRIDRPIDKDSELHPLVRWQFVGGLDEPERKAFLFTNVTDGLGRKYAHAGGGRRDRGQSRDLRRRHGRAGRRHPGEMGPCHRPSRARRASSTRRRATEVVIEGAALAGEGHGLDALPIPISTPGFDSAPTLDRDQRHHPRSRDRRPEHGHLPRAR